MMIVVKKYRREVRWRSWRNRSLMFSRSIHTFSSLLWHYRLYKLWLLVTDFQESSHIIFQSCLYVLREVFQQHFYSQVNNVLLDLPVSLNRSYNFSCVSSFVRSFFHLFVRSLIYSFVCSFRISSLFFTDFLHEVRRLEILKSDGVQFLLKINFCSNFGKKDPKTGYFAFLFFEIFLSIFPKSNLYESIFDSWRSIWDLMSAKILVKELLPKMFLANQIAGFFKM